MTTKTIVTALAACVCLSVTSNADVGLPIKVQISNGQTPPYPSQTYYDTLVVIFATDGRANQFTLTGDHFVTISFAPPDSAVVTAYDTLRIPFSCVPMESSVHLNDASRMLTFSLSFRRWIEDTVPSSNSFSIDLSMQAYLSRIRPLEMQKIPEGDTATWPGVQLATLVQPPPGVEHKPPMRDREKPGELEQDDGQVYTIRVRGKVAYSTEGAYGVWVRIYDADTGPDDQLASLTTDINGRFDVTVTSTDPNGPDIYMEVETANEAGEVERANWKEENYIGETREWSNYTNALLDVGWLTFPDEYEGALAVITNLSNSFQYVKYHLGRNIGGVDVQWPESDVPTCYRPFWNEIHLASQDTYSEFALCHEYGHAFWDQLAGGCDICVPNYCNGICDDGGCGHCLWCPENYLRDTWDEGFADWFGDYLTRVWWPSTGRRPTYNMERVVGSSDYIELINSTCNASPTPSPYYTEGYVAALLRDIEDPADRNDDADHDGLYDRVSYGDEAVLAVVTDNWDPSYQGSFNVSDFLNRFKQMYGCSPDLWETVSECGFVFDFAAPSPPTGVTSSTHTLSTPSSRPVITYTWTEAADDCSGVAGYSVAVSTNPSPVVDNTRDCGKTTSYNTSVLAAGTYYFGIKAVDRTGKISAQVTYGPIIIESPSLHNLTVMSPGAGWTDALPLRSTNDATVSSALEPSTLPGNTAPTYGNINIRNTGNAAIDFPTWHRVYLDSVGVGPVLWWQAGGIWGTWAIGADGQGRNLGLGNVRGGRHTALGVADYPNNFYEQDETDNFYGKQRIWTPMTLSPSIPVDRAAPPLGTAGWSHVTGPYYNCDGFRFTSSATWSVVSTRAWSDEDDYDCRVHNPSTGSTNGFGANLAFSTRLEGCLDAILVNRQVAGNQDWDVGVLDLKDPESNPTPPHDSFTIRLDTATELTVPYQFTFSSGEWIKIRMFNATQVGDLIIIADLPASTGGPTGPIHLAYFPAGLNKGTLASAPVSRTVNIGNATDFTVTITTPGWFCLVFYRDPREWPSGTGLVAAPLDPITVNCSITAATADLAPFGPAGWHSPLVARSKPDATQQNVPLPSRLSGDVDSTYLNAAVQNLSSVNGVSDSIWLFVDDYFSSLGNSISSVKSDSFLTITNMSPIRVPGGRHTIAAEYKNTPEIFTDNNSYAEQYVWTPQALTIGATVNRSSPPNPTAAWDKIHLAADTTSDTLMMHFNCDGLRIPTLVPSGQNGWWAAIGILPTLPLDADLKLFDISNGVQSGFEDAYVFSGWGEGMSDFVLINLRKTPTRTFDVGVFRASAGSATYAAGLETSLYAEVGATTAFGPFMLGSNSIVSVHEFKVPNGAYKVRLINVSGSIDWGVSAYPGNVPFFSKSASLPEAIKWLNGPGMPETLGVVWNQNASQNMGIAVWKAASSDLSNAGSYRLEFATSCCTGTTGNVNMSGIVDLSDLSALVSYLTGGGYVLPCVEEANVNAVGIVDLSDLSALVSYLTGGGYVLPNCP